MGDHFGELRSRSPDNRNLKLEETRFKATLDRGLKLLGEETDKLARVNSAWGCRL